MSTYNQIIDLTDRIVVLGSGPSALATIKGLLDAKKRIYILDAGITDDTFSKLQTNNAKVRNSSPKFFNKTKRYVTQSFDRLIEIKCNSFKPTCSLAKGGLSNIWGGGIQTYNSKELEDYPYDLKDIKNIYPDILNILLDCEETDEIIKQLEEIEDLDIPEESITFIKSFIAQNKKQVSDDKCILSSCDIGCVNCNRGIFNSLKQIERLEKKGKIEYQANKLITKIKKDNNNYQIICKDLITGDDISYLTSTVFCSLGVISTTKLVLEMLRLDKELKILSTPMANFILYSKNKVNPEKPAITQAKTFTVKNKNNITGNIFPLTVNIIQSMMGETLSRIFLKIIPLRFISRFYLGNLFFSSNYSDNIISITNGKTQIRSTLPSKLLKDHKSTMRLLKKQLKKANYNLVPFSQRLMKPGEDIHYGGTLPIMKLPNSYECDLNGQLKGEKNFFITDPSSLSYLPGKAHTFHSMCQSYATAKKFILRE